jgi:hypothetical protein
MEDLTKADTEDNIKDHIDAIAEAFPAPFSITAFERLQDEISEFIENLVAESGRLARRQRTDDISATHVEQAADYLTSTPRKRFFRHIGTLGGILLGSALSNILTMTLENRYGTVGILVTMSLAIIGAFLVAAHVAAD